MIRILFYYCFIVASAKAKANMKRFIVSRHPDPGAIRETIAIIIINYSNNLIALLSEPLKDVHVHYPGNIDVSKDPKV